MVISMNNTFECNLKHFRYSNWVKVPHWLFWVSFKFVFSMSRDDLTYNKNQPSYMYTHFSILNILIKIGYQFSYCHTKKLKVTRNRWLSLRYIYILSNLVFLFYQTTQSHFLSFKLIYKKKFGVRESFDLVNDIITFH